MMGLEEHLLGMFRDDFEFHAGAAPSHLGRGASARTAHAAAEPATAHAGESQAPSTASWSAGNPSGEAAIAPEPIVVIEPSSNSTATVKAEPGSPQWAPEAERELGKIPFFVRGKARRNTERFAAERGVALITRDTLYEAKAHYGR